MELGLHEDTSLKTWSQRRVRDDKKIAPQRGRGARSQEMQRWRRWGTASEYMKSKSAMEKGRPEEKRTRRARSLDGPEEKREGDGGTPWTACEGPEASDMKTGPLAEGWDCPNGVGSQSYWRPKMVGTTDRARSRRRLRQSRDRSSRGGDGTGPPEEETKPRRVPRGRSGAGSSRGRRGDGAGPTRGRVEARAKARVEELFPEKELKTPALPRKRERELEKLMRSHQRSCGVGLANADRSRNLVRLRLQNKGIAAEVEIRLPGQTQSHEGIYENAEAEIKSLLAEA